MNELYFSLIEVGDKIYDRDEEMKHKNDDTINHNQKDAKFMNNNNDDIMVGQKDKIV